MNMDKPPLDEFVVTWATSITASSPIIAAKEAADRLRNDPSAPVFYVERSEPRPALLNLMQIDLAADVPVVTPPGGPRVSWPADECVCTGGLTHRDDCPACARIQHLEDLIERWVKAKKSYTPSKLTDTQMGVAWIELCNAEDALKQEAEKL